MTKGMVQNTRIRLPSLRGLPIDAALLASFLVPCVSDCGGQTVSNAPSGGAASGASQSAGGLGGANSKGGASGTGGAGGGRTQNGGATSGPAGSGGGGAVPGGSGGTGGAACLPAGADCTRQSDCCAPFYCSSAKCAVCVASGHTCTVYPNNCCNNCPCGSVTLGDPMGVCCLLPPSP
jgi:hypothetical protein